MPRLTPAELALLDTLSAPIAADRRSEFLGGYLGQARCCRASYDRGWQHPSHSA
jgi:hypothetical protein